MNNVTLLENKVGGDACRGDGGEGQRRGGEGSECGCFRQTPSIICGLLAKEEGVVALSRVEAGQMRGRWLGREGLEQLRVPMEGRGGGDGIRGWVGGRIWASAKDLPSVMLGRGSFVSRDTRVFFATVHVPGT